MIIAVLILLSALLYAIAWGAILIASSTVWLPIRLFASGIAVALLATFLAVFLYTCSYVPYGDLKQGGVSYIAIFIGFALTLVPVISPVLQLLSVMKRNRADKHSRSVQKEVVNEVRFPP